MNKLIGQTVVCGFAAIWAWYGVSPFSAAGWLIPVVIAPSLVIPLLAWLRPRAEDAEAAAGSGQSFFIVVALEGAATFLAVNLAANLGHPQLEMPAVALVVGLHFLPLARIFRRPAYVATGLALCGLAAASAFIDGPERVALLGLGAAATLWLTLLFSIFGRSPAHGPLQQA